MRRLRELKACGQIINPAVTGGVGSYLRQLLVLCDIFHNRSVLIRKAYLPIYNKYTARLAVQAVRKLLKCAD
jgi:hypothetical protein